MTFHNREPKAWAALLASMAKAGFVLPKEGIIYQDGIPSYKHTSQSRRQGSVIGDFILSFKKYNSIMPKKLKKVENLTEISEEHVIGVVKRILKKLGPLKPDALLAQFYLELQPVLISNVSTAVSNGNGATTKFIENVEKIRLFDSQHQQLLKNHFSYIDGKWSIKIK